MIRPYGNRILIHRLPPPEQSHSGIILADSKTTLEGHCSCRHPPDSHGFEGCRIEDCRCEMALNQTFYDGREWPLIGEVLGIGQGARNKRGDRIPIEDLSVGDLVQFSRRVSPATSTLLVWDEREVGPDTFIIDYHQCLAGMRREGDSYRIWPLGTNVMIRRAAFGN